MGNSSRTPVKIYLFFIFFKKMIVKCSKIIYNEFVAPIAQLVEHFTRNEGVVSSSLIRSFFHLRMSESEDL